MRNIEYLVKGLEWESNKRAYSISHNILDNVFPLVTHMPLHSNLRVRLYLSYYTVLDNWTMPVKEIVPVWRMHPS